MQPNLVVAQGNSNRKAPGSQIGGKRQPIRARPPHQVQQKRFNPILPIVSQGNLGESLFVGQARKKGPSSLSSRGFDIAFRLSNRCTVRKEGN